MAKTRMVLSVCMLVLLALAAGCTKFTETNYKMVQPGMSEFEVEKILGEPAVQFGDTWSYVNEDPFYKAVILFKVGRVQDKCWADERGIESYPRDKDKVDDPARYSSGLSL